MAKEPMSQSKSPVVSVIIPTCNRAHLVGRAIRSVLAQTFQDWELIVVDDGSTDNSEEVVRSFHDERITYISHSQNRGVSSARNTGILLARGEYIAFLDSDDEWLPDKLGKQIEVFRFAEQPKPAIVGGGTIRVVEGDGLSATAVEHRTKAWTHEDVIAGRPSPQTCSTWLLNRHAWDEVLKFDENLTCCTDWDYLIRTCQQHRIVWLAEPVAVVHKGYNDHLWHENTKNRLKGLLLLLEKHSQGFSRQPRQLSLLHQRIGVLYYKVRNMRAVRKHCLRAIRAYPRNPKLYLWLIASLLGPLPFSAVLKLSLTPLSLGKGSR